MANAAKRDLAIITGAAGGMGAACAARLACRADLVLTDLDRGRLESIAAGLPTGSTATVVPADLSSAADVATLTETLRLRGGLRWIVHTAGLSPAMAGWRDVVEVDLAATAHLLDALGAHLLPGGAAVCLASIAGQMASDDAAIDAVLDTPSAPGLSDRLLAAVGAEPSSGIAYVYAKRGVIRLCERLATPWGKRGVRIVSISPGLMDTAMGRLELEQTLGKEDMIDLIPLARPRDEGQSKLPGRAADIAAAVDFLCSDAASFVTGCDLRIDGGLIAAMRR